MTSKIYKSAQGKTVDLGALILENETVRAVGNMNVNARGDVLNSANKVIESKNRQVQRQYKRQSTNVISTPNIASGTIEALARQKEADPPKEKASKVKKSENSSEESSADIIAEIIEPVIEPIVEPTPVETPRGGLAAAIARSQAVKQELMKNPRQLAQERAGVKKI